MAKQIDGHRHGKALHLFEQQGFVALEGAFAYPVDNLGDLQVPRDRGLHPRQLAPSLEEFQESSHVGRGHGSPAGRRDRGLYHPRVENGRN